MTSKNSLRPSTPDLQIDITAPCKNWEAALPGLNVIIQETVQRALSHALPERDEALEVSVMLGDDNTVQELNKTYRGKDKPTNVLSFPQTEPGETGLELGDIALAFETVKREAFEQNKTLEDHLRHLLVHGTLHLLHHDHQNDEEAKEMETLEIKILDDLGVKNPYEST